MSWKIKSRNCGSLFLVTINDLVQHLPRYGTSIHRCSGWFIGSTTINFYPIDHFFIPIAIGKKGDDIRIDALKGQPIASQRSTVASQYLQDEHADADIKLYDTQDNAYLDLTSGRVRAMMSDKVTGIDWLKTDAGKDYLVSLKDDFVELNKGIQNILKGWFNPCMKCQTASVSMDTEAVCLLSEIA